MELCVEIGNDKVPFIQLGDHKLRLDLEELDEEFKERSKNELGECAEVVEAALHKLREYIAEEPTLHVPIDDDKFLIKFLRPFKFNPKNAFRVLRKFYKFKLKHPKYAMNLTPNNVRHVYDNQVLVFLPTRSSSGARIMLVNVGSKWDPKVVSLRDMFRGIMVAVEIAMMEPKTQVGGVHVIINYEGFSLEHVYQFSPFVAKLIADWVQECIPLNLKGIHIINQSVFFDMGYAIFKPFLGELKKIFHFHGSKLNTLVDIISPEALPESLGGTALIPDYPGELLSKMFFHYEDVFERINQYCYLKKKTPSTDQ